MYKVKYLQYSMNIKIHYTKTKVPSNNYSYEIEQEQHKHWQ